MLEWYYYSSLGWESRNCKSEMPFVCKVLAGMTPPTTVPPPTIQPPVQCQAGQDDDWIKKSSDDEYCYKFVQAEDDKDTFNVAEDHCVAEVGRCIIALSR